MSELTTFRVAVLLLGMLGQLHAPAALYRIHQNRRGGGRKPFKFVSIEGKATGAKPSQQIVFPLANQPFTQIRPDSTWQASIHPGIDYAALLVEPEYAPPLTTPELHKKEGPVLAVAVVPGTGPPPVIAPAKILHFSGYDWEIRRQASSRGGKPVPYDPSNAWLDSSGLLHLRTSRQASGWAGAEAGLTQSLGQGAYTFTVRDISHPDPSARIVDVHLG